MSEIFFLEAKVLMKSSFRFLEELKSGKTFFYGRDKENRPIAVIRVRLHLVQDRDIDRLQKFCVYLMEEGRKLLIPPGETVTILFDLKDFGLSNMVDF